MINYRGLQGSSSITLKKFLAFLKYLYFLLNALYFLHVRFSGTIWHPR